MPEEVLVSAETGDDAAVYRLPDGQALVATVDFFTPIVDDPYDWGRIAAANAFSDVYAMGASPALALNISSWPVDDLSLDLLVEVLRGGQDIARAAGAVVLGGHTIIDPEPKYGMVALGFIDPERLVRNSTVPPGARLVLTKPLGTGIVSTAIKRGEASPEQVRSAVESVEAEILLLESRLPGLMTALNAGASEAMVEVGVAAATDVTGFGLLGHLQRMLEVSGVAAAVRADGVPLLPGVLDLARRGVVPSGTKRNHAFLRPHVDWAGLTEPEQLTLADAQTSGGLLIAVDPEMAETLQRALADRGVAGFDIGETEVGPAGRIRVTGRSSD